ncbi:diguanylate cyclase domain-containing protein [Roseovarius ramblicola]|uniref:Diguanylate cyclase domain-containing protein n=1 Tax=Roseovarius ramblicola TaxID=2022336 RepID=A0ABV5HYZ3_9RHOB
MSGADAMMRAQAAMLDRFCPMHVVIGPTGRVTGGGPTLARIVAPGAMIGARFLDLFELTRPRAVQDAAALRALDGARLRLRLRAHPRYALKGQICVLPPGDGGDGAGTMVVNLAFGIPVVDAVREFGLSGADFAVTDLATEMLYLLEAKTMAMEESRRLTRRLEDARRAAQEQALTDTLTGLRNRRAFDALLARAVEERGAFALLHLDLDFFKQVNDAHGHAAGDLVLRVAARRMLSVVRGHDVVARVGGDEFAVLLPGVDSTGAVDTVAGRLVAALEQPVSGGAQSFRISASVGATLSRDHPGRTADEVMDAADRALYAAKAAGRGCHRRHGAQEADPAMPAGTGADGGGTATAGPAVRDPETARDGGGAAMAGAEVRDPPDAGSARQAAGVQGVAMRSR